MRNPLVALAWLLGRIIRAADEFALKCSRAYEDGLREGGRDGD